MAQLLLAPLELGLPVQQPCLAEAPGQLGQLGADLGRKGGQLEPLGGHPRQHQVAQQRRQPLQQGSRFAAAIEQQAAAFGQGEGIGLGEGRGQLQQFLFGHRPQQVPDRFGLHRGGQQRQLIEQAFGIPQPALGPLGHHMQGIGGDVDRLLFGDPTQVLLQRLERDAAKVEALATAQNRGQHPLRVGGGEHEHHPWRRLLEGLEQGVEGGGREHVALVDHVDLPAGLNGGKARAFDQLTDVVHPGVGGGVDLDHIEGRAAGDGAAQLAAAAGFGGGAACGQAVQRAGQDPGARGLAGAAGAAEQIGGGDPARAQGVAQGRGDRLLAHQLVKALGAVFVVQGLVGLLQSSGAVVPGLDHAARLPGSGALRPSPVGRRCRCPWHWDGSAPGPCCGPPPAPG